MRPEHIPVDAYRLLRQIVVNKELRVPVRNPDNDAAVGFLLTRGLAVTSEDGAHLRATEDGVAVGRLMTKAP